MTQSLYERIGGEAALMAAVDLFYKRVLEDDLTRPFFDGLDMQAQIRKQVAFMAWAFGGPERLKGRQLRTAHANLVREKGLSDIHFNRILEHLRATLEQLGIGQDLVGEAMSIAASTRGEVLGH